jgi:ABC-2 type transport system permease protein
MNFSRILVVTRRIFIGLRREKRSIGLMLFAPILAMCVFGVAFSGDINDVDIIVVNYDEPVTVSAYGNNVSISISEKIIDNIDEDVLNIEYMSDESEALKKVKDGEVNAVVIFPEDFTRMILQQIPDNPFNVTELNGNATIDATSSIVIRSDNSNVNVANAVIQTIADAMTLTLEEQGVEAPIQMEVDPVYAKNAEFIDMFVPGIIAFVIFLLTTLLTLISFVGERTQGTLERLLSTPITEAEIVFGYGLAFGIIGMLQAMILLTVGILVFDIIIVGNVLLAFGIAALLAVVSQALGILLSSAAKREAQAVQFLPIIVLPVFLLAGIFWPVEAIPVWLRPASYAIPPTYAVNALRSVVLRGWGIDQVWPEVLVLIGFAALFLFGAIMVLKRSKQ